jgi:hypothetical protein
MKSSKSLLIVVCLFSFPLLAQYGSAPNGYYPPGYAGSIFTGSLESAAADTQEMTLVYAKGNKTERFVGRLESACGWKDKDGTAHSFKGSDIPKGTILTAFYNKTTKKSDGQKTTEISIFAISYVELNGKRIPDDKRVVISCSELKFGTFKVS